MILLNHYYIRFLIDPSRPHGRQRLFHGLLILLICHPVPGIMCRKHPDRSPALLKQLVHDERQEILALLRIYRKVLLQESAEPLLQFFHQADGKAPHIHRDQAFRRNVVPSRPVILRERDPLPELTDHCPLRDTLKITLAVDPAHAPGHMPALGDCLFQRIADHRVAIPVIIPCFSQIPADQ